MRTISYALRQRCRVNGTLALVAALLLVAILAGCKGTTINPTEPGPEPTPVPTLTPTVVSGTPTPTPTPVAPGYDGYAETPDDPTIRTLTVDDSPYRVTLDYTGDIDWYKVAVPANTAALTLRLYDIPPQSDFDMIAYDADLVEFRNGRSMQAGNTPEVIELEQPGELIYVQIYSYSGRGNALLSMETTTAIPEIEQLTYEDVLATEYPLFPRGTSSGLLDRRIETKSVDTVRCDGASSSVTGVLTIGQYAHVGRNMLTLTDHVDGWAVAVFNGSIQHFDEMTITVLVSIASQKLGLTVTVPSDMRIRGEQYLKSVTRNEAYYAAVTYGDLWADSARDIRISGGVAGDLRSLALDAIFTQEVTVDWSVKLADGTRCSGRAEGTPIEDFKALKSAYPSGDLW
jgi:hypothetical protein